LRRFIYANIHTVHTLFIVNQAYYFEQTAKIKMESK